jgi:hypothetical protein
VLLDPVPTDRGVEDRIEFAIDCIDAGKVSLDLELIRLVLGLEIWTAAQEGHRQRAVLLHVLHHVIERADVLDAGANRPFTLHTKGWT